MPFHSKKEPIVCAIQLLSHPYVLLHPLSDFKDPSKCFRKKTNTEPQMFTCVTKYDNQDALMYAIQTVERNDCFVAFFFGILHNGRNPLTWATCSGSCNTPYRTFDRLVLAAGRSYFYCSCKNAIFLICWWKLCSKVAVLPGAICFDFYRDCLNLRTACDLWRHKVILCRGAPRRRWACGGAVDWFDAGVHLRCRGSFVNGSEFYKYQFSRTWYNWNNKKSCKVFITWFQKCSVYKTSSELYRNQLIPSKQLKIKRLAAVSIIRNALW